MAEITTKKCPICSEEIKIEAHVCRYCKARFDVATKGYCAHDHQLVEADENGKCSMCGGDLMDTHVDSTLIEESMQKPPTISNPIAQSETRETGTKKVWAIIGTIVISLLCGFPGVLIFSLGVISITGLLSPDMPPDVLAEALAQNELTKQELLRYSFIFIGAGILLILVPIIFGIATLRKKKHANDGPKKSFGTTLARIAGVCVILAGLTILTVKSTMPKINAFLATPVGTSTPVEINIKELNAKSAPGKTYDTAQQLAVAINANELVCKFKSANISNVPIYDIGECWFVKEEWETLGYSLNIWIELFDNAIPPLVQKTREGFWDGYRDSIKGLSDPEREKVLVGPNWQINGKLPALIKIQNLVGGDILDFLSETDRTIYITR